MTSEVEANIVAVERIKEYSEIPQVRFQSFPSFVSFPYSFTQTTIKLNWVKLS